MNAPLRRGACPGLSVPMQTGDGLLVRMLPVGTLPLGAFASLCAAARQEGNGVVEVTARGSVQVRGLTPASAPRFAIADGIPVHAAPLAGLDPDEILDAEKLAAAVRRALARRGLAARLGPKVSVAIDGGGALRLDRLSADVRLCAELENDRAVFAVSVGGARAVPLGLVAPEDASATVIRLLDVIANSGRGARARDLLAIDGTDRFTSALGEWLLGKGPELDSRLRANRRMAVIGTHPLRKGLFGCGVGLAFGHADAAALENLTKAAGRRGATGLRAAPDRALIFIGFSPDRLRDFISDADQLGFIVRADDPRRFVVACAGAPICASAHIAARALAPRIAADCDQLLSDEFKIHVSGCAKGCAHPGPTALTVVGTPVGCSLVSNGTARDAPFEIVRADELAAAIARSAGRMTGEVRHV